MDVFFSFFWLLHKSFFSKSKCTLPHSKSGSGGLGKLDAESKHCNSPSLTLSLSPPSLSSSTNATFGRILFLRSPLFWRETILRPLEGCTLLKLLLWGKKFFLPVDMIHILSRRRRNRLPTRTRSRLSPFRVHLEFYLTQRPWHHLAAKSIVFFAQQSMKWFMRYMLSSSYTCLLFLIHLPCSKIPEVLLCSHSI